MNFTKWLDTFLEEKNIELEDTFSFEDEITGYNLMPYGVVVEAIKNKPALAQKEIQRILILLDFKNLPIKGYLEHIGKSLAKIN